MSTGRHVAHGAGALEISLGNSGNNAKACSGAWFLRYRAFEVFHIQISFQCKVETDRPLGTGDEINILVKFDRDQTLVDSMKSASFSNEWQGGYVLVPSVSEFERHRLAFGAHADVSTSVTIQFAEILVTGAPTNRPPTLIDLDNVNKRLPFRECEGPCTSQSDCAGKLVCFLGRKDEAVPGCSGRGKKNEQYCHVEDLVIAGDNGKPSSAFPLGECQGDCDSDDDCAPGLICLQRHKTETVPGCTGFGQSGKDYCYLETLSKLGNNGSPATAFPLDECRGDCDEHSDCAGNLLCFERRGKEAVPGCPGVGGDRVDYCYREDLEVVGENGTPASAYPLKLCQGHCKTDSDCDGTLRCFQRDGTEAVPNCPGAGKKGKDYCFDDGSVLNVNIPPNVGSSGGRITYKPGFLHINLFEYVLR